MNVSMSEGDGISVALPAPADMRTCLATIDVMRERLRQITDEGCTARHDDQEHSGGQLAAAAAAYALQAFMRRNRGEVPFLLGLTSTDDSNGDRRVLDASWPFESASFKPKDEERDLIRAAALILARIEQLRRVLPMNLPPEQKPE